MHDSSLPLMTAGLPGIGGVVKATPEDFQVEEIPAYLPVGEGEFRFLWVEKRGLSSEQLVSHLARELHIAHQDIGLAGMKDRQALTRQWVSVPVRCEPRLADFRHDQIRILNSARHRNKLRTGHLQGNRFSILVREVVPDAAARAAAIARRLRQTGVPNYFGEQRFGRDRETLDLGRALLRGTASPGEIPRARRKFLLRLALSAAQSHLFNQALAARLRQGTAQQVQPGDVLVVAASGGPFVAEDVSREQARCDAGEVVISGPLFGPKMKQPAGEPARQEAEILAAAELPTDAFSRFANLTSGTRRPYLVRPEGLTLREEPDGLRLEFALPSGSYATVVLEEFQKRGA